jgi:hypothetical protein
MFEANTHKLGQIRGLIQIDNRLLSIGRVPKLPIRRHKKPISCLSA